MLGSHRCPRAEETGAIAFGKAAVPRYLVCVPPGVIWEAGRARRGGRNYTGEFGTNLAEQG
jgi:hypothetical protein